MKTTARQLPLNPLRLEQIEEALEDLERIFADPECFGLATWIGDYAESLASEFVGSYREDEIVSQLAKLAEAEAAGHPKEAFHHLGLVRRKVDSRLREWWSEIDKEAQVAGAHFALEAREISTVASSTTTASHPSSRVSVLEPVGASS